ncbi:hypothetical protein P8452_12383 [Trifolium repens]|nr:hypothetical protein P8452_12383 [Trifolium repens]
MSEFQTQNLVTVDAVNSQPPSAEQEQHLKMDDISLCCDQIPDGEGIEILKDEDDVVIELDCQNDLSEGGKEFLPPAVGMEFESYDDSYNYYICYAKEVGFCVRVKNSWFKRNSREKYGAVLCCSSQGFKRMKDVNNLRKDTRTGCPAMIRMRLVESQRWRIREVTLEHNHILGAKIHKSIKNMGSGTKKKLLPSCSNAELSRMYTKEIFTKFQFEVGEMFSCFGTTQLHVDGPIIIFLVKERVLIDGNRREIRDFEVLYSRSAGEVRCICCCFNFYGYLCRHALCVLNFNGVEEIPPKYILSRWRKDYKRLYIPDQNFGSSDDTDRIHWCNQLFRSALQVVEEGVLSVDHYNVALQAFEESFIKVRDVEQRHE